MIRIAMADIASGSKPDSGTLDSILEILDAAERGTGTPDFFSSTRAEAMSS